MMGTRIMNRHCWKYNGFCFLRCILQRQFFYSTTTSTEEAISSSKDPNSLSSLTNLLVGSLGFSETQALYASSKLTKWRQIRGAKTVCAPNFLKNADLVIRFLEQKGLEKPQIRNLVYSVPRILTSRIQQNLEPKIAFFERLGLSVSEFDHAILEGSLDSTIRPAVETLRAIMGSDDNVVRVIKKFTTMNVFYQTTKCVVCNVSSLRAQGIPLESIQKRMLQQPSPFFARHQVFKDKMVEAEEKWGVSPCSSRFLHAIHVLVNCSEKNIESKCRVFKSFGWERSDLMHLFRSNPNCLAVSEEMIKARLSFFMGELGYNPHYIAARHNLMIYSFKKRVLPRHLVLKLLKGKGLIRENLSLYGAINVTEPQFLKRFIHPFENDVPNLRKIYIDSIGFSVTKQDE